MERPVDTRAVVRRVNNPSQTTTSTTKERWSNVEGIFSVRRPERLAGKHVLLVDDVMTTGATIGSCAESIVRALPDVRVSIAALYASKKGMGIRD
jgi:predicted amidophosphoribosyltransferase